MKSMVELEFSVNVSPSILFPRLSTAGGLVEWFADDISINSDIYTFIWNGMEQQAKLVNSKKNSFIRFKWLDEAEEESYFEFRIISDDITGDIALIVTDFAEEDEQGEMKDLWETQINNLKYALGIT